MVLGCGIGMLQIQRVNHAAGGSCGTMLQLDVRHLSKMWMYDAQRVCVQRRRLHPRDGDVVHIAAGYGIPNGDYILAPPATPAANWGGRLITRGSPSAAVSSIPRVVWWTALLQSRADGSAPPSIQTRFVFADSGVEVLSALAAPTVSTTVKVVVGATPAPTAPKRGRDAAEVSGGAGGGVESRVARI